MNRRDLLKGMAGILASGIAPSVITTAGVLMPMHRIMLPDEFTPSEARRLLGSCAMRFVRSSWSGSPALHVEVQIYNRWMHLDRTDLLDNVTTYNWNDGRRNLEQTRAHYLTKIRESRYKGWIGARINDYPHCASFSVVDSCTDG